jgi:ATP-dependent Zn protease
MREHARIGDEMERQTTFNIWYVMLALLAVIWMRDAWVGVSQVQPIPYSEFLHHVKTDQLEEISISKNLIEGKLKRATSDGRTRIVTTRVDPQLASDLSQYDVKFTGVVENTFFRDLIGWLVPAIIFIDELDALGRARGAYPGIGGHDEKEQTLNQLLVELDGFDSSGGLVILAATNRPEILDPALLRAGRFDRQVLVDRPDRVGRVQILRVHLPRIRLAEDVEIEKIAELTPGFSGADLANLVNEAALVATRRDTDAVTLDDFTVAVERIVAGLEKKNRLLNPEERRVVAYHEMGHALVAMSLPGSDVVHKVSIIPRGVGALGYTIQRPTEDRFLMRREELEILGS